VKFALRDLFHALYREFPSPPGDYEDVHGVPVNVRSFVRYYFPKNRESFLKWISRFDRFFEDVYRMYLYQLRPKIEHLKEVHRESVERTLKL